MRRTIYFTAFLLSFALSNNSFALCTNSWTQVDPSEVLPDNTVCTSDSQEQHRTTTEGDNLWDYKKGPSDPVDPTAPVGNWTATSTHVTYNYGGPDYTFILRKDPSSNNYTFCEGPKDVDATIISGIGGCGF